jgi:peptide subunit release factor 1 (eRF1)
MSVINAARSLAEQRPAHRVVSLYVDLDPERFATPPARASQIQSLLDEARREVERDDTLDHQELVALREDLDRIDSYLHSSEPPFQGARSLAVFCSVPDELFEVVQLPRPVEGRVVIEQSPYVDPLLETAHDRRWCVALVNRRTARVLTGPSDQLRERGRTTDDVHGQHDQGGWSQANYERSYEKEADDHLRRVAADLDRLWRRARFERLALGGPTEIVPRFEGMLSEELRRCLVESRVEVDVDTATDAEVRAAVAPLVEDDERRRRRDVLQRLASRMARSERAAGGPEATIEALNERRVETLLIEGGFVRRGGRCPNCGLLSIEATTTCPADGSRLDPVDLREAAVESAVQQDAEVMVIVDEPDLGPFQGIAALLRF